MFKCNIKNIHLKLHILCFLRRPIKDEREKLMTRSTEHMQSMTYEKLYSHGDAGLAGGFRIDLRHLVWQILAPKIGQSCKF